MSKSGMPKKMLYFGIFRLSVVKMHCFTLQSYGSSS